MRRHIRAAQIGIGIVLACGLPGCASLDASDSFVARWGMRGAGALGAFALHEVCHLAAGAAFGADIEASVRRSALHLEFSDISSNEHQVVALAGNACTGIAAEIIVDTGKHKKSNLGWGAAAFHSINVFGYAFSKQGDAEHWEGSGGSTTSWQVINATHSSRIGAQLAWDSEIGDYLKSRWRIGPPMLPPVSGASEGFTADGSEPELESSEPNLASIGLSPVSAFEIPFVTAAD
ncbi:MAG: hypothetical protein JRG89_11970 [Deltaproteobacteria bacterium]|nr:hypothetical protein [Deltaproteobacteria bacterium]